MSSTDVTEVTAAVGELAIQGPGTEHVHNPRPTFLDKDGAVASGPEVVVTGSVNVTTEPTKEALFDDAVYLDVPTMDGNATDDLIIAFAGSIKYEATSEEGRALFDSLTLGKSVTLQVEGVVAGKAGAYKEKTDGTEVITGKASVKVHTVYVTRPEDLS